MREEEPEALKTITVSDFELRSYPLGELWLRDMLAREGEVVSSYKDPARPITHYVVKPHSPEPFEPPMTYKGIPISYDLETTGPWLKAYHAEWLDPKLTASAPVSEPPQPEGPSILEKLLEELVNV